MKGREVSAAGTETALIGHAGVLCPVRESLARGEGARIPARVARWAARCMWSPPLRPWRIAAAFAVAVGVDAMQLLLGPLGWVGADEVLDLVAMVLTIWLLGFHLLLLPTFVIEVLPVVDVLPTWTGCVGLVVAHRRRQARTK